MTDDKEIIARHIRPLAPIASGMAPDLSRWEPFSAILFDVYGTLLVSDAGDTGYRQQTAHGRDDLYSLFQRYGIEETAEQLMAALHGAIASEHAALGDQGFDYPEVDVVQIWQRVLGTDDAHWVRKFALEYELIVNPVYPMPGLKQLLQASRIAGMPIGIISNAQFYTPLLLEYFIESWDNPHQFDPHLTFFSYQYGCAKPSEFLFRKAARRLLDMGIHTAAALYVGNDMRNDIMPAKKTGFKAALFAGDRRSLRANEASEQDRNRLPDLVVTDLRQLIPAAVHS